MNQSAMIQGIDEGLQDLRGRYGKSRVTLPVTSYEYRALF
jgi:hypothetical protein